MFAVISEDEGCWIGDVYSVRGLSGLDVDAILRGGKTLGYRRRVVIVATWASPRLPGSIHTSGLLDAPPGACGSRS